MDLNSKAENIKKIDQEKEQPSPSEKKEVKVDVKEYRNLLLYNKERVVVSLLENYYGNLKDGYFNENTKYISLPVELYEELSKKLIYKVTIKSNVDLETINSIDDFDFTVMPPVKPIPSKEQVLAMGLMENTLKEVSIEKQAEELASGLLESSLSTEQMKKQINVLSKAILELTCKKF